MRSVAAEEFLTDKGYKREKPHAGDPDYVVANYYRTLYDAPDIPLCLTNDKPPQVYVRESYMELSDHAYHSFNVGVRNEAPQGWIDFKFYSISESDLLERFGQMESALDAVWRTLFSIVGQPSTGTTAEGGDSQAVESVLRIS